MREYEIKYQATGVMLIHALNEDLAVGKLYSEYETTNEDIVRGIHAGLEIDGNEALQVLSVKLVSEDFTDEWKQEVMGGATRLGYDEWVMIHKGGNG